MKKLSSNLLFVLCFVFASSAQDPAGNCIEISLAQFNTDGLLRYANCGNDVAFNTGSAITLEVWIRVVNSGDNQKVLGKTNGNFNSGYVMGIDQGRIYPEIWTPGLNELLHGFIPPIRRWVHLATTFENGDSIKGYVNGKFVGGAVATSADIVSNNDPFIIGIAPWDLTNFQTFGEIDEVRVWNVARTHEEIRQNMHRQLAGTETGLVAYYNFNESAGTTLTDHGPNALNCNMINVADNDWIGSRAVVGNTTVEGQLGIEAMWNGKGIGTTQFVATDNGLSTSSSALDSLDYLVYGHNGGTGNSTSDLPSNAVANFERMGRIWYLNEVGNITTNLTFDLTDAAAGGTTLQTNQPASYYTLLFRSGATGTFTAIAMGDSKTNNSITFNDVTLQNGYYSIGVGDAEMTISTGGIPNPEMTGLTFQIYPNPGTDQIWVDASKAFSGWVTASIINPLGQKVNEVRFNSQNITEVSLDGLAPGAFILVVTDGTNTKSKMLVKE